jgi:hypothetical protein
VATTEPKTLIIHERYLSPYDASSETADQIVRCPPSTKICTFTEKVDVPLPVHYRWIDTVASAAFLSDIPMSDVSVPTNQSVPFENVPVENSKKILVGRIYGHLRTLDNQYIIEPTKSNFKILCFASSEFIPFSRFLFLVYLIISHFYSFFS